jgi:hypothetical protein
LPVRVSFHCMEITLAERKAYDSVGSLMDMLRLKRGNSIEKRMFVPIIKANDEEQTLTGVVLQPEVTDAQGDIISAEVIRQAAHNFLAKFNTKTKLGLQHKVFKSGQFSLAESYLVSSDMTINSQLVKAGSWIMVVKVLDTKLWKMAKEGKLTGFSIGGRAKVEQLSD